MFQTKSNKYMKHPAEMRLLVPEKCMFWMDKVCTQQQLKSIIYFRGIKDDNILK